MTENVKPNTKKFALEMGGIFHEAANTGLRLGRSNTGRPGEKHSEGDFEVGDDSLSPYCCNAVGNAIVKVANEPDPNALVFRNQLWDGVSFLKDVMLKEGMTSTGFGVFDHIEIPKRQEARWFFLMLLATKYEGKTIKF